MKLFRLLLIAALAATFSAAAWADGAPSDPKITIKGGCCSTLLGFDVGSTAANPIFVLDGSGDQAWQLNFGKGGSFNTLYVEVIPYSPAETSYFLTEAFTGYIADPKVATGFFYPPTQGILNGVVQFPGFEIGFTGTFLDGEHLITSVPEPSSVVLLLAGMLVVLLAAGIKLRDRATTAA